MIKTLGVAPLLKWSIPLIIASKELEFLPWRRPSLLPQDSVMREDHMQNTYTILISS